jgi:hypothetical protein
VLGPSDAQGSVGLTTEEEESMVGNSECFGGEKMGDGRPEEDIRIFRRSDVQNGDGRPETGDGRKASGRRGAFVLGPSDAGKVSPSPRLRIG